MTGEKRTLSAIVAVDRRLAIGRGARLLCHLPDDLRRFKRLTMGHSIVMGRKTFDSLPTGALPGRENIVVTRDRSFAATNVIVVHSVGEALAAATREGEIFVIGGAEIYRSTIHLVDTLYITVIGHTFADADVFFPTLEPGEWQETSREEHDADDRHPYPFAYVTLRRITGAG